MNVDLGKYQAVGSRVYTGRDRGEVVRKKLNLDSLDNGKEIFNIIIPEGTMNITSSFFLGLFGISVRKFGEKSFRERFKFQSEERLRGKIEDGIRRALKEKNALEI